MKKRKKYLLISSGVIVALIFSSMVFYILIYPPFENQVWEFPDTQLVIPYKGKLNVYSSHTDRFYWYATYEKNESGEYQIPTCCSKIRIEVGLLEAKMYDPKKPNVPILTLKRKFDPNGNSKMLHKLRTGVIKEGTRNSVVEECPDCGALR